MPTAAEKRKEDVNKYNDEINQQVSDLWRTRDLYEMLDRAVANGGQTTTYEGFTVTADEIKAQITAKESAITSRRNNRTTLGSKIAANSYTDDPAQE